MDFNSAVIRRESCIGNRCISHSKGAAGQTSHLQWRAVPSEASSPIILAENLTKVYAAGRIQVTAVRGVSLAIEPGEFVAIVGPSGSGKSTLFYLLGGLTQATRGAW